MKIVFMGTPDFAVPTLVALKEAGHEIVLVVTQPDTPRDRGKKMKYTPVKEKALEYGIEVVQPEKVKGNSDFLKKLEEYNPDVIVVVAYGRLLPIELINIPKLGCINVHASLLPRHRGAAPIQRAILDGDEKTGVTIMYVEEALDGGDMLAKAETNIGKKNAGQLHDELSVLGAKLLAETLPAIEDGSVKAEKQDEKLSTYAPMIFKKDGLIDFNKSPEEIERQIRGLAPWPGAYTHYGDKIFKIWEAEVKEGKCNLPGGTILQVDDEGMSIAAGGKILLAKIIQLPGKKRVAVKDYLKGNSIDKSTVLG